MDVLHVLARLDALDVFVVLARSFTTGVFAVSARLSRLVVFRPFGSLYIAGCLITPSSLVCSGCLQLFG